MGVVGTRFKELPVALPLRYSPSIHLDGSAFSTHWYSAPGLPRISYIKSITPTNTTPNNPNHHCCSPASKQTTVLTASSGSSPPRTSSSNTFGRPASCPLSSC